MVMPFALIFMTLTQVLFRQEALDKRSELFGTLAWQEMARFLNQFEARTGNLLCQLRSAGVWTHRIVFTGHDHGRTVYLRQHVQHIGAGQRAKTEAETDGIIAEIAAAIGFVVGRIAERL